MEEANEIDLRQCERCGANILEGESRCYRCGWELYREDPYEDVDSEGYDDIDDFQERGDVD